MTYKPKEFVVESTEEFQEMIDSKDFRIAEAVVEGIFANINTKKKHVHLLSVIVEEEDSVFDISCERKFFVETLEENLSYYVREERYEDCQRIANLISELKENQIGTLISQITGSKK
jgi:hypothetical protein